MIKSKIKNIICEFKNYFSSQRKYIFGIWLFSCIFILGFTLAYNETSKQNTDNIKQANNPNTTNIETNSSITPVVAALTGSAITALAAIYAMHQQIKSTEQRENKKKRQNDLKELLTILIKHSNRTQTIFLHVITNLLNGKSDEEVALYLKQHMLSNKDYFNNLANEIQMLVQIYFGFDFSKDISDKISRMNTILIMPPVNPIPTIDNTVEEIEQFLSEYIKSIQNIENKITDELSNSIK